MDYISAKSVSATPMGAGGRILVKASPRIEMLIMQVL
jgi:hypothetical protein